MKEIEWAIEILAVLDLCINMYCFIYVIKTFNTKNCINYIMCIDSIMSAISSLVVIIFYAVGLKNSWTCTTVTVALLMVPKMSHLCSPHKWPMEIGHHKWSLKAIVIPNAKHEGYNGSFLGSRVVTKCHWSRVRTTQIPLFSLLTTSKSPHLP